MGAWGGLTNKEMNELSLRDLGLVVPDLNRVIDPGNKLVEISGKYISGICVCLFPSLLPLKIVFLIRVKKLGTISTVLERNFAENCDPLLIISTSMLRLFKPF